MLERPPYPRLQAITGSFVLNRRIATIDDEGHARDQAGAAPPDQLSRARPRSVGRRQSRALEQHGLMYVTRPRNFRSGFGEVHHRRDVGRNAPVLAAFRQPDRLGRCFADARSRCGRLQAELSKANVEARPILLFRRRVGLPACGRRLGPDEGRGARSGCGGRGSFQSSPSNACRRRCNSRIRAAPCGPSSLRPDPRSCLARLCRDEVRPICASWLHPLGNSGAMNRFRARCCESRRYERLRGRSRLA